jgi:hypothetical protein
MSALGHKRTTRPRSKSDFVRYCPKADKHGRGRIVRFVPIADSCTAANISQIPYEPATRPPKCPSLRPLVTRRRNDDGLQMPESGYAKWCSRAFAAV